MGDRIQGTMENCLTAKVDIAPDLDSDGISDLVVFGDSCNSGKGDLGALRIYLSSLGNMPFDLTTQGAGNIRSFWHEPRPGVISKSGGLGSGSNNLAVMVRDEGSPDWVYMFVAEQTDLNTHAWVTDDLAPIGRPVLAKGHVADYTKDGILDIAAFTVAWYYELENIIYQTRIYLFEGPDFEDISPLQSSEEFRAFGPAWDFNLDGNMDLLLNRSMVQFAPSPGIEIFSPSTGFELLFTQSDNTAISIGIEGRYY